MLGIFRQRYGEHLMVFRVILSYNTGIIAIGAQIEIGTCRPAKYKQANKQKKMFPISILPFQCLPERIGKTQRRTPCICIAFQL